MSKEQNNHLKELPIDKTGKKNVKKKNKEVLDCNPKYKISELLQSTTLLHITDT